MKSHRRNRVEDTGYKSKSLKPYTIPWSPIHFKGSLPSTRCFSLSNGAERLQEEMIELLVHSVTILRCRVVGSFGNGRARKFFQGFDNTDYLNVVEFFLTECIGSAVKCCGDSRAVLYCLCNCKFINKKKETGQCDHNLF